VKPAPTLGTPSPSPPLETAGTPRSWWINVHENCLHLWELRDANLEAQWRSEAQGHKPT
jgi:hypothetical protein